MKIPEIKTYTRGKSIGINTRDTGRLMTWLGNKETGFGEDDCVWDGKDMGQSDWLSLDMDNLYIPV